jgi:hypothetical protein
VHWGLRLEELCGDVYQCPHNLQTYCTDCETSEPAVVGQRSQNGILDTFINPCSCGSVNVEIRRSEECPVTKFEKARTSSEAGRLLNIALEMDHVTKTYQVNWYDVTAEQDKCVRILEDERNKYQREQMKK